MRSRRRLGNTIVLGVLLAGPGTLPAATGVGSVIFSRGAVTAQQPQKPPRLLGSHAPLKQGDIITTGPKSLAVLKLADGGRMSLRPDTVFTVAQFSPKKDTGSLFMKLFKGGLRMISGFISKHNPRGVKLTAVGVTIGIRGTEFDARICQDDCGNGQAGANTTPKTGHSAVIGRVALMRGTIRVSNRNNKTHIMTRGAPLYEGDTLATGPHSFAVLALRDRGRITLKANTSFKIEKYRYQPPKQKQGQKQEQKQEQKQKHSLFGAAFRLIKGGARFLTGLIAKTNHSAFTVRTSVATIGIRGTGFDLDDLGPCTPATTSSPDKPSSAPAAGCGLHASVWLGSISAENDQGTGVIKTGQNARIASQNAPLEFTDKPPAFGAPRPDKVDIDFDNLFKTEPLAGPQAGLYVSCYVGHCTMSRGGQSIDLGAGESGYAPQQGGGLIRFDAVQPFQADDPYLQSINREFASLYEGLAPGAATGESRFECTVQ